MSRPHDWIAWEDYQRIHNAQMAHHAFVREDHLEDWEFIGSPPENIQLSGWIVCRSQVAIRVVKTLEVRQGRKGQMEVRGVSYALQCVLLGPAQYSAI